MVFGLGISFGNGITETAPKSLVEGGGIFQLQV